MPSRIHLLSSRLAAKAGIQQVDAIVHADRAALVVDRALAGLWRQLLAVLRDDRGFAENRRRVLAILAQLQPLMRRTIGQRLERIARWGHRQTARTLVRTLPVEYLRQAAPVPPETIREADEPAEPAPSDAELRRLFSELIFPPPSLDIVQRIVFAPTNGRSWQDRIAGLSRLASPDVLANIVASGMSAGKTQAEIARELLPAVNGVRASAKRVARTEGLRVAAAMQQEAHGQVDDLVAGQQIHATLDANTRPLHRARNGRVWMKDSGQSKQEALQLENGAEFPPDAPNCRCHTSLILKPPPEIADDPAKLAVFETNAGKVVPDPATYSDWFNKADDRRRRLAVGARKYAAVRDQLGDQPVSWEHFVGEDGLPLTLDKLKAESATQRAERLAKVRATIAERRRLIQQAATFGFLPQ